LSTLEIAKRMRLGLITADQQDSEDDQEEWQDMDSESGDAEEEEQEVEQYTFAHGRRSSINLQQMSENFHDSQQIDFEAGNPPPRNLFSAGGSGPMELSSMPGGSSRDLGGLIREVVKENDDDETSTVDGDQIDSK
jgi:hypothetical protein